MLTKEMIEQMKNEPKMPDFTEVEKAYRRGYSHGFLAAKRTDVTEEEVYQWRHGDDQTAPPGSCFEGKHMHGLTNDDPHRFFINRLKPKIEKRDQIDIPSETDIL